MAPRWLLELILTSALRASALTWWVDESCENSRPLGPGTARDIVRKGQEAIQLAVQKLEAGNEDMLDAFHEIYKWDYSSPGANAAELERFKDVVGGYSGQNELHGVLGIKEEPQAGEEGRKASYLRIYCDNGERYRLRPDDEHLVTVPNEELPEEEQIWWDERNQLLTMGHYPCSDENEWFVTVDQGEIPLMDTSQAVYRATMDICDAYVLHQPRRDFFPQIPDVLRITSFATSDGDEGEVVKLAGIDTFRIVGEELAAHEMTHAIFPWTSRTSDPETWWANMQASDGATAVGNAECYAYLATTARLIDAGYKLDPEDRSGGDLVRHDYYDQQ